MTGTQLGVSEHGPVIVIMGVTGSGKTTVGQLLAQRLALPFYDADDYHPAENRKLLSQGIPLTDKHREPWLADLAALMKTWSQSRGAVLACSALKRSYRQILRAAAPNIRFVYLQGDRETISSRLATRHGHLVTKSDKILAGQFADLEPPQNATTISIKLPTSTQVDEIINALGNP